MAHAHNRKNKPGDPASLLPVMRLLWWVVGDRSSSLDPVATSSSVCQSLASEEKPHREYVFFHCWDCVWVTSIIKIHLLSSIESLLIHCWQTGRNKRNKVNFFEVSVKLQNFEWHTKWTCLASSIMYFIPVPDFCPLVQTAKICIFSCNRS